MTQLKDIEVSKELTKLHSVAMILQRDIQENKFQAQSKIIRKHHIPFRNSSILLGFLKEDKSIIKVFQEENCYESTTIIALSSIIKPHFKVIDCGTHYGFHSLRMAALLDENKGGQLYSFEANPISVQYLNASILLNNYQKKYQLYNYAIYNQTQVIKFNIFYRSFFNQMDILQKNRQSKSIPQRSDREKQTQFDILAICLDEFFPPEILPEVDFLKIDVENADLMGLQCARNLIKRSKNIVIIMEWWYQTINLLGDQYVKEQLSWFVNEGFHF